MKFSGLELDGRNTNTNAIFSKTIVESGKVSYSKYIIPAVKAVCRRWRTEAAGFMVTAQSAPFTKVFIR